jgi:hypothetical protein
MKIWHAVYTKDRCEKKVAQYFKKHKIENYFPLNRKKINGSKSYPLIQSILFAKISNREIHFLKNRNKIINLAYWRDKPFVFNEEEIGVLKRFVENHIDIQLKKINLYPDSKAFFDTEKVLINNNENESNTTQNLYIRLSLPSIGYVLKANTHNFNGLLYEKTGRVIELVL